MSYEVEQIGDCTLYRGDARDFAPPQVSYDVMITDPPWGVEIGTRNDPRHSTGHGRHLGTRGYHAYADTYEQFVSGILPRLNRFLDHARCAAVFTGPHIHEQRKPVALGGVYVAQTSGRTPWGSKNFLPVLFYGIPPNAGQHRPTVIRNSDCPDPSAHPCPKPLSWMHWLVNLASSPDDVVIDPFAGSCTTALACLTLGRRCIMIEIDPAYFDLGCRRIEEAYRQLTLFPPAPVVQPMQERLVV